MNHRRAAGELKTPGRTSDRAVEPAQRLVDVAALLRCQGVGWAAAALSVGRSVTIDARGDGLIVRGDAARLAQAVGNLLANAMEHGDGEIALSAAPATAAGRCTILAFAAQHHLRRAGGERQLAPAPRRHPSAGGTNCRA